MTTARAATPAGPRRPRPGRAVLAAETRLFLREPGSLFWIVAFPTLLLVVLGFVPGFDEDPAPAYRELRTRAPVYFWPMWLAVPGVALLGVSIGVTALRDGRFSLPPEDPGARRR